jgi:acetylornithine deacetylase/succinyl-diaminopimelate desuccinylase-like protein
VPAANLFQSLLGLPVALMGFGTPRDNIHGANESIAVDMFRRATATSCRFLEEIARGGGRRS